MIADNVTNDFINRDFSKLIFMKKRILKTINTTASECGIGMYFKENEAKPILPDNQPNKPIPAIKSIKNRGDSFLFIIRKKVDFIKFIFYFLICFVINSNKEVILIGLEI